MTIRMLFVAASGLLLASCAGGRLVIDERHLPGVILVPLANQIRVSVDEGTIVVNREPLRVKVRESDGKFEPVEVTLKLDTPELEFAPESMTEDPLKWEPRKGSRPLGRTTCRFGDSGRDTLICTFTPVARRQSYAYTLRLRNTRTGEILVSDPSMDI